MGKSYYLLAGIQRDNGIRDRNSCWERKNLVQVPEILQYIKIDKTVVMETGEEWRITFYVNAIGSCVILMDYGQFDNDSAMKQDYEAEKNSRYDMLYGKMIEAINDTFHLNVDDTEWIMPGGGGEFSVSNSSIFLSKTFCEENSEYVALIDCAMIYQSVIVMSAFFKSLMLRDSLNKYEQYQVSFYVQSLNLLQKPVFFLVNTEEIGLFNDFYKEWELESQIQIAISIADKAVAMFSFLADYREKNKVSIMGILVPYISFLFSYDAIMGLLLWLLPSWQDDVDRGMGLLLAGGTVVAVVMIFRLYRNKRKENRYFKNQTS